MQYRHCFVRALYDSHIQKQAHYELYPMIKSFFVQKEITIVSW